MSLTLEAPPDAVPDVELIGLGYGRISSDDEMKGWGVERHAEDIERMAERDRCRLLDIKLDNDYSASRYARKARPGYEWIVATLRARRIDRLYVYNLDRLLRQPKELEALIDLAETLPHLLIVSLDGQVNLRTRSGRSHARLRVMIAADEADATSERLKRKYDQLADKGGPKGVGRARAFGYGCGHRHHAEDCQRDDPSKCRSHCEVADCPHDPLKIIPAEAELYRQAVEDVLTTGASVTDICRRWIAAGVVGSQGATVWRESTMRQLLTNARQAGRRVHRGQDVGQAKWPAIISYEQHKTICRLLLSDHRKTGPRGPRSAFSGLFTSSEGRRLQKNNTKSGKKRWTTRPAFPGDTGYLSVTMRAELLEAHVLDLFFGVVEDPHLSRRIATRRSRQAKPLPTDDPAEIERQLQELADDKLDGRVTRAQFLRMNEGLIRRLEAATASVGDPDPVTAPLGDVANIRKRWPELTADQQRAYLSAVFETVILHPDPSGGGSPYAPPNLDRVEPVWRL